MKNKASMLTGFPVVRCKSTLKHGDKLMVRRVAVVMDPISEINPKKDTTLTLLLAAKKRNYEIHYLELGGLSIRDGEALGKTRKIEVSDSTEHWYRFLSKSPYDLQPLASFDCLLMRKDPPFDMEFIYATYILERAKEEGLLVVNDPKAIRDSNEKLFTTWFPELCPPTIVTRDLLDLRNYLDEQRDIIVKPLDGMGGQSIFRVKKNEPNASVIFETLTSSGNCFCMAQRYLPEIKQGDKRVLVVDGNPIEYALARVPAAGELRGNLAAGGTGRVQKLSPEDYEICSKIGPTLKAKGLLFVGLDIIGTKLTEINVTSPTCAREIEREQNIDIGGKLFEAIDSRLSD